MTMPDLIKKPPRQQPIEPIVKLLFAGVFLALGMMTLIAKWAPNDGQTFQVLAGIAMGFMGMLGLRIKPADTKAADKPPVEPPL